MYQVLPPARQADLKSLGWACVDSTAADNETFKRDLLALAATLGTPVRTRTRSVVDELVPVHQAEARPRSLSQTTGIGPQPWHTDMAHRPVPARYLVLGMLECSDGTAATELLDAEKLLPNVLVEAASTEPFLVRTGAKSFYATIKAKGQPFLRFDPGCMQGATQRARALMAMLGEQSVSPTHVHLWRRGRVLVLDNWKFLHRRADASDDLSRVLFRVCVEGGC
jgi:alpha-ketoglutarate-dependent taurine dioxygenase